MHLLALILLVSLAGRSLSSEEKPAIYDLTFATKLVENKKLSLNCLLSDADTDTTFEWFLNGQKVVPNENIYLNQHEDSSMLNVRSMSLELAGEYECRVANRFGQDSRSISVKLEGENDLKIPNGLVSEILIEFFSQAQVSCRTDGHQDETELSVFNPMPNHRTAHPYNQMGKTVT